MPSDRPNVLLLLSDEHSYRCFSRLDADEGGEPVRTPTLDGLAERGTAFERAYCSVPLCTPSRISMLTGREPRACGAWTNKSVIPDLPTLPGTLAAAGYETCLVGKMHLGGDRQFAGFANRPYGDLTGLAGHETDPLPNLEHEVLGGNAKMPTGDDDGGRHPDPMRARTADAGVTEIPESLLQETNVVEETVAFLREHDHANPDRPWLACASFSRPHFPLTVPSRYFERYWPNGVTEPTVGREDDAVDHPLTASMVEGFRTDAIDEEETLRARAAYFACVDYLDDRIGDLLAMLDRSGLLENTIVVYASDHGELAGERGLWWKHSWHEEAARVPLTVQTPAHRRGERDAASVETPVSLVDLYPTLCGLAGVEVPGDLDGVDLSASVERGTEPERGPVFVDNLVPRWGEGTEFRAVVDWSYKYVGFRDAPELLFDLDADPHEQRNLAPDAEGADAAALSRLRELVAETMDFDAAERERLADREDASEHALAVPKGTGNAYLFPDGRLVDAGTPLYKPDVLADDPEAVFDDWPAETRHDTGRVGAWRRSLSRRWSSDE